MQWKQLWFFSLDCLDCLPPWDGSAADVSEFQEHSVLSLPWCLQESALLSPGQGAQLGARRVSLHLPGTVGQNQAFNTEPAVQGLLSADFPLLSQGIRSRKSSCWRLWASAEAIRECWRQSWAVPRWAWKGRPCEGGSSGVQSGFIIFGGKAEHVTADKRLQKSCITALIRSSKYKSPSALGCFVVGQGADTAGMWRVGGCVKSMGFLCRGALPLGLSKAGVPGGCGAVQWQLSPLWAVVPWHLSWLWLFKIKKLNEHSQLLLAPQIQRVSCLQPQHQPYRHHLLFRLCQWVMKKLVLPAGGDALQPYIEITWLNIFYPLQHKNWWSGSFWLHIVMYLVMLYGLYLVRCSLSVFFVIWSLQHICVIRAYNPKINIMLPAVIALWQHKKLRNNMNES